MELSLKSMIELTTPQYLLISIAAPLSAFMIINKSLPGTEIFYIIISLSLAVLGFNTSNAVYDLKIDKIDKPKRPIPSKKISVKEAKAIAFFFLFLSLLTSLFVNISFFILILIFIAVSYSYSKFCLKKYIWGSPLVGAVLYGSIPFLAALSISPAGMPVSLFFLFTAMFAVISSTKDFEDMESQKKFRLRTLPIIFGVNKAKNLINYTIMLLISMAMIFPLWDFIGNKFFIPASLSFIMYFLYSKIFDSELEKLENRKEKIVTQSSIPTLSIIFVILVQFIFGVFSVIS
jgi:geranylgeranylglycerol-phosphate geranylgeranyltransferase